jgi:hypothetical protein
VRCKPHRPTAVVTPFGNGGHAHVLKVACASRTARITVRRAGVRHRPHNGGFYISVYRGKGVSHAKSPVARSRNIATGDLGRKAKLSRVTSQYKLRARRFGRGRFQVTVHALNPGCTRNAPMVMLTLHGHGARSAMGAAVDCKSGSTSLVFDTYNESGRFRNRGLSFAIFRSQTVAATSNPLHARCASRLTPGKRCY